MSPCSFPRTITITPRALMYICYDHSMYEMGGGRWKSQNRKNMYLSPYVEEPLNSKVIKGFVPEPKSR